MHRRWEWMLALVRLNPFRCRACSRRFFVFRRHRFWGASVLPAPAPLQVFRAVNPTTYIALAWGSPNWSRDTIYMLDSESKDRLSIISIRSRISRIGCRLSLRWTGIWWLYGILGTNLSWLRRAPCLCPSDFSR